MARLNLRIVMAVGLAVAVLVAPTLVSAVPRVVVLGILPAIVGVALIAGALHGVVRQPTGAQIILATLSIVLSVVALWTLKRMLLDGAWATYLPYYAIAAAIPLVMIQLYSARVK